MTSLDLDEFRALFAQEAEVRLATLGRLTLQMERDNADESLIGSIFREVHTLKGSAAVVGLDRVSRVAHALEEQLEDLRTGRRAVTPPLVDAVLSAVDGLATLIGYAVGGEDEGPEAATAEATVAAALALFADRPDGDAGPNTAPNQGGATPGAPLSTADALVDIDTDVVGPGTNALRGGSGDGALVEISPPADVVNGPTLPPAQAVVVPGRRAPVGGVVMVPVDRLDDLVRLVGESATAHLRVGRMLATRFGLDPISVPEFFELSRVLNDLQERTMRTRMVPVATATDQLGRAVRDIARSLGKLVFWEVRGGDTELDRGVLHQLTDSLLHLVRNAVDHGIETPDQRETAGKTREATIRLHAMQLGSEVIIAVTDDGRGIDVDRVRSQAARQGVETADLSDDDALQLVFRSGLSTSDFVSDISGRGVGLDVVRASVEAVRGRIEVRSQPGCGAEFRLAVPITLAVLPCLLVAAGGQRFALPLHSVIVVEGRRMEAVSHAEGRRVIWVDDQPVVMSDLAALLGSAASDDPCGPVVVVTGPTNRHAFRVEELLGRRDVVVKGVSLLLPRLDVVAGASVEPDGSILVVLDPPGLIERARQSKPAALGTPVPSDRDAPARPDASVLVVDDALTVRELQRNILQRAGYQVRVAGDGIEALAALAEGPSDLVLTDVEMPRMDGFALTEAIRAHPTLSNVPVLVLTSRSSDVDRQRGLDAGADGYIVKSAFDERGLLTAIERLLGRRP